MNLTYVIGDCEKKEFEAIRRSIMEKLSPQDQLAVSVKENSDDVNQIARDIAYMFQQAQTLPNPPDAHRLNVVYIYGRDEERYVTRITRTVNICEKVRKYFNIWTMNIRLVMLVNEWPIPTVSYRKMLSAIPYRSLNYAYATTENKDSNVYDSVFILSDKNSQNAYCKNDRADAAALVVHMLLSDTYYLGHGVYSAGIGKLSSTAHETGEYARHQAARAIREGRINHSDVANIKELCGRCLPGNYEDARQKISAYLNEQVCSNFCFIEGESIATDTRSTAENKDSSDKLVKEWEEKLLKEIKSNPFVGDAIHFFKDEEGFKSYLDALERDVISQNNSTEIKKKFLGRNNQMIDAYNGYIKNRDEEKKNVLKTLMDKFRARKKDITGELYTIEKKFSDMLAEFESEPEIIQAYRTRPGNVASKIDEMLWNRAIFTKGDCRDNFMESKEPWQQLIERCLEQAQLSNYTNNVVSNLVAGGVGDIITQLEGNINEQAMHCLASPRGQNFADPVLKRYYVPPQENIQVEQINKLLQLSSSTVQMKTVSSRLYSNIEELAVFRVDTEGESLLQTADKLTAFIDLPELDDDEKIERFNFDIDDEIILDSAVREEILRPEPEEEKPDDGWHLGIVRVGRNGYAVTLNWRDKNQTTLHLKLTGQSEVSSKIITISRGDFESNGSQQDISASVGYGLHKVQLVSLNGGVERELASCEFSGKEHSYVFESECREFRLTDDVQLNKYEIQLNTVDGSEDAERDEGLFYNIDLVLNDGHKIKMPSPRIKHKKVQWTVYTDCDNVSLCAEGKYAWGYKTDLMQK